MTYVDGIVECGWRSVVEAFEFLGMGDLALARVSGLSFTFASQTFCADDNNGSAS